MVDIFRHLDAHFRPLGLTTITTKEVGYPMLKIFSAFDSRVSLLIDCIDLEVTLVNTKSKEILGMKYERDMREVMIEMVQAMLDLGIIQKSQSKCNIF